MEESIKNEFYKANDKLDFLKKIIDSGNRDQEILCIFFKLLKASDKKYIDSLVSEIELIYPKEKDVYVEIAKYYYNINDNNNAIKYFEKYKNNGGDNEEVLLFLAKLYRLSGNLLGAYSLIKTINILNEDYFCECIRVCISLNKLIEVLSLLEELLKQNKKTDVIDDIAQFFLKEKKYDELEQFLNKYLVLDRNNIKINYYIYLCYKNLNKDFFAITKIFDIFNIDTSWIKDKTLKLDLYKLITQCKHIYNSDKEKIKYLIIELYKFLSVDANDNNIIFLLSFILRDFKLIQSDKEKIIDVLYAYSQQAINPKLKNIFLNEAEILEKKTILKSKPRQMTVVLTTKCNLKCEMCKVWRGQWDLPDILCNFLFSNMKYLERIIWEGGEVFLYKNFFKLFNLAGKFGVEQDLLSNGLLLKEEIIKSMTKYKVNLKLSIDAVTKEKYELLRYGGNFEQLLKILDILKEYSHLTDKFEHFRYSMAPTIMSVNFMQLYEIVEFAIKYKFHSVAFQKYIPNCKSKTNFSLTKEQCEEIIQTIKILKAKSENKEIPIKIETNFSIDNINDIFSVSILDKNIYDEEQDKKEIKVNQTNIYKDKKLKNVIYNNKDVKELNENLFCLAPWKMLFFDYNNILRFACNTNPIYIDNNSTDDIWNCEDVVEYRKYIVNNDLSNCNILCRNTGEYGNRTKLGII